MSMKDNMDRLVEATAKVCKLRGFTPFTLDVEGRELQVGVYGPTGFEIGHFSISYLPGCKDVLVFHRVLVHLAHRNKGYGSNLHALRLHVAREIGARLVLCTVLAGNSIEKRIIQNFGWKRSISVTPNIELWTKELAQ